MGTVTDPTQQPPQPTPATVSDQDVRDVAFAHRRYQNALGERFERCASCGLDWPCPTIRLTRAYHALRDVATDTVTLWRDDHAYGTRPMDAQIDKLAALLPATDTQP